MFQFTISIEKGLEARGYKTLRKSAKQNNYRIDQVIKQVRDGEIEVSRLIATCICFVHAIWAVTFAMVILISAFAALRVLP
ncbi:MAG: hypothetical protein CO065_05505 [Comamonadaceae bacterium CG_4_9_14_0_8_um_filter_57_21]|nr:MAG: hypothetical protein CO065_05505 [Comamonadaceae bacterium CG_4_9_14_0_8_um_filter_57_21]